MFVFCVNATSTTEIYTYCHTLSLHDALPSGRAAEICSGAQREIDERPPGALRRDIDRRSVACKDVTVRLKDPMAGPGPPDRNRPLRRKARWSGGPPSAYHARAAARSEENTSELQSLMRISYAVFCLEKQQTTECEEKTLTIITTRRP